MKAKTQKIAIYGGSFDPPHYGHYDIVKNLERSFDRVIVVPSYISPFKTDEAADSAKIRLKLCKKVFASNKTEVLSREISKKGVSYSIDTVKYLKKKNPDAKLFFVIGSEELVKLTEWHEIDELKKLVAFFVVPRPGYKATDETLKTLKKRGIKIKTAKFDGLNISSTKIKIDIAFGKQNTSVPDIVIKTAEKEGLFNPYGKYVEALYRYNLSDKRLTHTYGVAIRGAELAKLYGYSVRDAVIACILHDVAKSVDPDDYVGKVDAEGFPAPTVHGPIGAYIARREFGISDEMYHAIRHHSTGDATMTLLDEIVYLADKTEPYRTYNEVYYFRYLCAIDKDYAMYRALSAVSEYKETRPCEYTAAAIELYRARCEGKTPPEMPKREVKPSENTVTLPIVRGSHALGELKTKAMRIVPETQKGIRTVEETGTAVRAVEENSTAVRMIEESSTAVRVVTENSGAVRVVEESSTAVRTVEEKNTAIRAVPEKKKKGTATKIDEIKEIAVTVAKELSLHKARDIDIVDLAGKTIVADYFVIASVSSTTAVKAQMGYVEDIMTKKYGLDPLRRDVDSEWIALDYGGVIVHIFTDKTREFYNIERLWSDGNNITRIE
ncbi:MAG: nicotinate (nicotinamide) nucleotide adenylyltransferase [Clostridiales bacterium]|nr:nicotinate (nicotinamide) nucleotide adenylyltransferase [Clostridiales bacterium]